MAFVLEYIVKEFDVVKVVAKHLEIYDTLVEG